MAFFEFPHTRTYDADLGWLISNVKNNINKISDLLSWKLSHENEYRELKLVVDTLIEGLTDPVEEWDGTKAYNIYSLVKYEDDIYIALKNVPAGVLITNTEYWALSNTVYEQIAAIEATIASLNEKIEKVASLFPNTVYAGFKGRLFYPGSYHSSQGTAYLAANNELAVAQFNYSDNTTVKIVIFDYETGLVKRESAAISAGHTNNLSYDPTRNELITDSGFILDADSLLVKRVTAPASGSLVCDTTGNYYSFTYTEGNSILTFNTLDDNLEVVNTYEIRLDVRNPIAQQITIYKNLLFAAFANPNQILVIDYLNSNVVKVIDINKLLSDFYPVGEFSTINFIDENYNFIITGKPRALNPLTQTDNVGNGVTSIGYGNLLNGIEKYTIRHPWNSVGIFGATVSIGNTFYYAPLGTGASPFFPFDAAILINADFRYSLFHEISVVENLDYPLIFTGLHSRRGINLNQHSAPSCVLSDSVTQIVSGSFTDPGSSNYVLNLYNGLYALNGVTFPNAPTQNINFGLNSRNIIGGSTPTTGYVLNTYAELKIIP